MASRIGKIASLPDAIREQANQRTLDGHTGREVIAWLNAQPEVESRLRERFGDDWRINDQNWSDWRRGGYIDWLDDRKDLLRTKSRAELACKIAAADAGTIAAGVSSIAAGLYMQLMEVAEAKSPEEQAALLGEIVPEIVKLRTADQAAEKMEQDRTRLAQTQDKLDMERTRLRRDSLALFIEWVKNERARQIAESDGDNSEKIQTLGRLMFGEDWEDPAK